MGAEAEGEKMETKPNPISEAQFLSWKRRKVMAIFVGTSNGSYDGTAIRFRMLRARIGRVSENTLALALDSSRSICVDKDPCVPQPPALHMLINGTDLNFHDAEASARKVEAARKRSEDIAAGTVQMNGRELFQHEPWVFDDTSY